MLKIRRTLLGINSLEEFLHTVRIDENEYYLRLFNNIYKQHLSFRTAKLEVLARLELDIIERIENCGLFDDVPSLS